MNKNTASQKWTVFAFTLATGAPLTGDAANITANLRIDDGVAAGITDTNPTEQEDGYYVFDLSQAETNGNKLAIFPASSTSGIQVIGCPAVVYTTPASFQSFVTPPTAAQITDDILNELLSGHSVPGSAGIALTDILGYVTALRSALTDPRAAALDRIVGTLAAGTHNPQSGDSYALIGVNGSGLSAIGDVRMAFLDASILSRLAALDYDIPPTVSQITGYIDANSTQLIVIKAKTDQLVFTTPNKVDATATLSGGGDATEAHQLDMIDKLKGIMSKDHTLLLAVGTFDPITDSTESIRNRGDIAWITGVGMSGSNAITINVHDGDGANVVEASVEIWDQAGTAFYEKKFSNSNGQAIFNMDSGTYTVKIHKAGYSFTDTALIVSVTASVTYVIIAFVIPAPSNPDLCRIYDYAKTGKGEIPATCPGTVQIVTYPFYEDSSYFETKTIPAVYNATTGLIYFDVIRGATVEIKIDSIGINAKKTVPYLSTVKLSTLMVGA